MGFMGALGKAMKAPAKAVGKLPGMNKVNKAVGKAPGMGAMQGAMGIGPSGGGGGGLGAKMQGIAQAGGAIGNAFGQKPQPMPEIPQEPPPMQADMPAPGMDGGGMEVRDAPMPQMQPQIGQGFGGSAMPPQAQPQQGGFMSQLAQKYGQARPGMGQPQQRGGNMGRAMGGAMRRMF